MMKHSIDKRFELVCSFMDKILQYQPQALLCLFNLVWVFISRHQKMVLVSMSIRKKQKEIASICLSNYICKCKCINTSCVLMDFSVECIKIHIFCHICNMTDIIIYNININILHTITFLITTLAIFTYKRQNQLYQVFGKFN